MKVASLIDTRTSPTEHRLSCSCCLSNQLQFHEVSPQHAPLHWPLHYSITWAGYPYNPQTRSLGPSVYVGSNRDSVDLTL